MSMTNPDRVSGRARPVITGAFLEYGFRPFFLGAGVQAVLAIVAWLAWLVVQAGPADAVGAGTRIAPQVWHAHEMIFGYGLAVVAGFLLTAVPSWTGRRPVSGGMLAVLFGLWLAARAAMWLSFGLPPAVVAVPELAFIAMLATLVVQALLSGWSKRNFLFLPVLAAFLVSAALYHAEAAGIADSVAPIGQILGLDLLLVLITVIGGRIIPAFTTNALRRGGGEDLPRSPDKRDRAAILAVVLLTILDVAAPGTTLTGWVAVAAAISGAVRMVGWRTHRVLDAPILWILHLGYAWLVAGFLLKGLALVTGSIAEITAIHALSVGAVGSMTLGVMTRAALGHTGRALRVSRAIAFAYLLVSAAALVRVLGPVVAATLYMPAMLLSGALWSAAFLIFVIAYWPILTQSRITSRPH